MKIANDVDINEDIFIAGFPQRPANLIYCSPVLRGQSLNELMDQINLAFCDFQHKVLSSGKILNFNRDRNSLLSIDYSATSGMSGSPAFYEKNGQMFIVGINLGGSPLPYQRDIVYIIDCVTKLEFEKALKMLNKLRHNIQSSDQFYFHELERYLDSCENFLISNDSETWPLIRLVNLLAVAYKKPEELNHNIALPFWNDLLQMVKRYSERFIMIPSAEYASLAEFLIELD